MNSLASSTKKCSGYGAENCKSTLNQVSLMTSITKKLPSPQLPNDTWVKSSSNRFFRDAPVCTWAWKTIASWPWGRLLYAWVAGAPSHFLSCFIFLYLLVIDHRNFNLWWTYICIKSVVNFIKSLNVFGKAAWTWCLISPTSGNETEWEWNDRKLFLCFITWIWKGTHLCILLNLYQFPRRINQRSLALHRMWIFKKCHWLWGNTS